MKIAIDKKLRNNEFQTIEFDAEKVKLTKTFLNKAIKWSSSRYEPWKKKDVVEHIYKAMSNEGAEVISEGWHEKIITQKPNDLFHSGSYCQSGSLTRHGTYYVDYEKKVLLDIQDNHSGEIVKIHKAYTFI